MAVHSTHPLLSARRQKSDGYIVIIVLLLTAVLLMLGLSLATRTTEEVYQSGQEADTTRVFNAAETGIEAALYKFQSNSTFEIDPDDPDITDEIFDNNASDFRTTTESTLKVTGEQATSFNMDVKQGEALTLAWRPDTIIKWAHSADCSNAPAVIITLYNKTTPPETLHLAYNPAGGNAACNKGTGFAKASLAGVDSSVTLNAATFGLGSVAMPGSLLRIRPVYNDASFKIENSSATKLVSEASDNSDAGAGTSAETRKIEVIRTEPAAPSIFDYAVFSGGSLTKN